MNKIFIKATVAVSLLLTMVACGPKKQPQGNNLGYTEYYESSLFKSYEPKVMTGVLDFKLNKDAQAMFAQGGTMTFYVSTDPAKVVAPEGIIVYCNGEKSNDASFDLKVDGAVETISCELGLEFEGHATEGIHQLYILYANKCQPNSKSVTLRSGNRDIAHTIDPSELKVEVINQGEFYIEKIDIANPGSVLAGVITAILLGLFILSLIISRMMNPRIGVNRLNIMGEYQTMIRVKGYRMVVLTNTRKKQSFINKLYTGTILYVVHPSWTSDITITPSNKRMIMMRGDANTYLFDDQFVKRGEMTSFVKLNEDGTREKIDIQVN